MSVGNSPPSLLLCFSWTPPPPPCRVGGTAAEDHTGICTIKLCITALGLHDKTPFQLLFQTYSRKKKQTLSVQFRQPKIRKQYERKNNVVLTICGNIVNTLHGEQSHLSHGWGRRSALTRWVSPLPLPVGFYQSIRRLKKKVNYCFNYVSQYYSQFFSCLSYLQSGSREWMGVLSPAGERSGWILAVIAALFGPLRMGSGVGVLESALP